MYLLFVNKKEVEYTVFIIETETDSIFKRFFEIYFWLDFAALSLDL